MGKNLRARGRDDYYRRLAVGTSRKSRKQQRARDRWFDNAQAKLAGHAGASRSNHCQASFDTASEAADRLAGKGQQERDTSAGHSGRGLSASLPATL